MTRPLCTLSILLALCGLGCGGSGGADSMPGGEDGSTGTAGTDGSSASGASSNPTGPSSGSGGSSPTGGETSETDGSETSSGDETGDPPPPCDAVGFDAAVSWSLPDIPATNANNDPMMNLARDLQCDTGGYSRIATVDMDGDGLPDLVETDDCGTGGLGASSWNVYLNQGDGFASTAVSWALPNIPQTNANNDPMMNLARDLQCDTGGYSRIATVDMDGDGLPDLVETDDCGTGGLGAASWNVYLNQGDGFASSAVSWALPNIPQTNANNDPMMNLARDLQCDTGGYSRIATVDINRDGRPDLIETDDCGTGGLGLETWAVYLNEGDGFAQTAIAWPLPPIPATNANNDPMMNLARDLQCDTGGYSRMATIDLNGDGVPEIVHSDDCGTGGLGLETWDVYPHACAE